MNKKVFIPAMILLFAAIMMAVSFVMPYVRGLSLFEFMEDCVDAAEYGNDDAILCLVFMITTMFFTFMTLLFSALRKPIPVTIFVSFACIFFFLLSTYFMQFTSRFKIGYYMFYIMSFVVFVTSIILQVGRVITKNEKIQAQAQAQAQAQQAYYPPQYPNM